jgi:hypothetical protein
MPYSTEFIDGGRGVIHLGEGVLTGDELIAGSLLVRERAEREGRIEYGLTDLSAVIEFRASPKDLRRLADAQMTLARIIPRGISAVVATSEHIFGMARMWEAYAEDTHWAIRVFRDREAAELWLRETIEAMRADKARGGRDP